MLSRVLILTKDYNNLAALPTSSQVVFPWHLSDRLLSEILCRETHRDGLIEGEVGGN